MLWIAFVIPMLFVNVTFIIQSVSDPFGWGWDFFGTANTPWHQFVPRFIPWFQAILILTGLYLSLRNILLSFRSKQITPIHLLLVCLPIAIFLISITAAMIFFFTN
jgi:hypothetical protein